jgi:gliding motility-associated-like protein
MDISKLNAELKFTRDTNYCEDSPIKLFNESNGGKEYEWIYPDGTTSNSYNGEYLFQDSGAYVVQLVAIDSSQCPYRDTAALDVKILMYPKIEFDIDTFLCEESELKIKTIGGPIDSNYTWYTKDTVFTKKNGHVLNVKIDTTTTFNVSYVNRCGISINSIEIPRYYTPLGKLKTDTVCENDQQAYFFPIEIGNTMSEINNKAYTLFEDTINFSGPSEQYIIKTIGMCGSTKDTFDINRIDIYPKLSNDTVLCPGEFATLKASGGYTYKWENELITENSNDSSYTIQVFETNHFPISIYKGICYKRDSIEIQIYPKPFQAVKNEYKIHFGEEIEFPVNPNFNYSWTPLNYLKISNRIYFSAVPEEDITYYYTYKSDESCNLTDSIIIKVIFPLYIPNTFTPNGDGKNEEFGAYSQVLDGYDIHIFDRWGNLAFHSTSLDVKWDGTVNGKNQQEDVYVYILKYKLRYTNKWEQKVGRVNLIR